MNTYLGIGADLDAGDVPAKAAEAARFLFLEGYLYDKPGGKAAFEEAARLTRAAGGKAGITLSDPFCVERHRDDFRRLLGGLDLVIGNHHEWQALYQTDLEDALVQASAETSLVVCTRSDEDVWIRQGSDLVSVPVMPATPVDVTGAGDQFAAGFLYGLSQGKELAVCGRMGVIAATEVIGHVGPRPEADIAALFRAEGLA